jgi:hypothetical protein
MTDELPEVKLTDIGSESNIPVSGRITPKGTNVLTVTNTDKPTTIMANSAVNFSPIIRANTVPAITFRFGDKQLTFRRADDGTIDAEYDPTDLTEAAQTVVNEVMRLIQFKQEFALRSGPDAPIWAVVEDKSEWCGIETVHPDEQIITRYVTDWMADV